MKRGPNEYGAREIPKHPQYDEIRKVFEFHSICKWVSPTDPSKHRLNDRDDKPGNDHRNIFVHAAPREVVITEPRMKYLAEGIARIVQQFSSQATFDTLFAYGGIIQPPAPLPLSNYLMIKDVILIMKAREKRDISQLLQDDKVWTLYFEPAHVEIARNLYRPTPSFVQEEPDEDDPRNKFLSTLTF